MLLNNPRYIVFEPDPRNVEEIKKRSIYKHITLEPFAISDVNGTTDFYLSSGNVDPNQPDWTGSSSILKPKRHLDEHRWCKFDQKTTVPTITLDSYCKKEKIDYIDFIWADVQGAEAKMVDGGQNILKATKYLYCEYSNAELYDGQKQLNEWIEKLPGSWKVVEQYPHDILLESV